MGNKSSSHSYPYWNHHPPYSVPYDGKRGLNGTPGAYVEPYVPHFHRSMVSLHDSGYLTSPGGTMAEAAHRNSRLYGSRISLNQVPMAPAPPPVPDTKTLKKLEKMQKKHEKLMKKLAARGHAYGGRVVVGPPILQHQPPAPMYPYARAMSYDDLQRAQLDMAEMRLRDEWRKAHPNRRTETTNKSTVSSNSTCVRAPRGNGSLTSSSPVTSSSEGRTVEQWNSFGSSHEKTTISSSEAEKNNNNNKNYEKSQIHSPIQNMQAPLYMSTPKSNSKESRENVHNIVVKVERSEHSEITREESSKTKNLDNSTTYAQPIIHQRDQSSFGSRTSMGTSQFRCDQSEIDFSWVTEEEDRLRSEKTNKDRIDNLPECYFGIEPRLPSSNTEVRSSTHSQTNSKDGKENHKSASSVKHTANLFEEEARRIRNRDQQVRQESVIEPRPDYIRSGPAERRINRMSSHEPSSDHRDRALWRTSIAF